MLKHCRAAISAQTFLVTPIDILLTSFFVLFVLDAFENETGKKVTLKNTLIQLRKCVAHPYLFNGMKALLSPKREKFLVLHFDFLVLLGSVMLRSSK